MHEVKVKSILSSQNRMNIYRGCSHGCIYCDARSTCYQLKHKFEDIEVKSNAVELLKNSLRSKKKKCMISTGGISDPYLHLEKQLKNTRKCLEIIDHYGFGVSIHTKSDRVLRDLDLLKSINKKSKCVVQMTLTTTDEKLCKIIEPNVCSTKRRAEVLKILHDEGIPTIVWLTPILPFINDTEENIRGLLDYCIHSSVYGIIFFNVSMTLRDGNRQYFYKKLDKHFPGIKDKYIKTYGNAYEVTSSNNKQLKNILREECHKHKIVCDSYKLFNYINTFEDKQAGIQLSFFND